MVAFCCERGTVQHKTLCHVCLVQRTMASPQEYSKLYVVSQIIEVHDWTRPSGAMCDDSIEMHGSSQTLMAQMAVL